VHAHGIALQSGFEALFEALAATTLPYCLATNSRAANADECLRLAGVAHLFPTRLTRDHVEEGKPAPEIFLKAAALLGAGIGECWAAEDSYPGILAAKRAGAFAICIPPPGNADPRAADMADLVLHDLAELAEIIDKRFTSAECHRV
jgi:beta-phosphoglucomutase-like phosphatase (HAD superfamily)